MGRQVCSIPFWSCTTNARLGCFPDGHLAGLLPYLSDICGPVRCRCSRQIHGDKWRTSLPAPRLFCSAASASRQTTVVRGIPWGGADLRCAEHQAEICVLSAPAQLIDLVGEDVLASTLDLDAITGDAEDCVTNRLRLARV